MKRRRLVDGGFRDRPGSATKSETSQADGTRSATANLFVGKLNLCNF
jgi:hypothetical protein